ncbi:MAG: glucose-6-phosphate dehydrogenase [Candidatus Spechtbacterales bacterium]
MKITVPTTIVIFGATGDLARNKLFAALFSLFSHKLLPKKFRIIGFARSKLKDREFQKFIEESIKNKGGSFVKNAMYQPGFFEDPGAYTNLGKMLSGIDREFRACSNKLFYLAAAPKYYKTIFENLANSGLTIPCADGEGWTRVLVEKPFGENIRAAQELDELLSKLFREEQIFRIDHYLARETMQNILTFRFSNRIFEPLWNNQYIDRVELKLLEKGGVGERGAFYDEIGALRDVGQNHMLQMLALVAMGHPQRFDAGAIRRERAKILEALRPIPENDVGKVTLRGQYSGYRNLSGVKSNSNTETYFKVTAHIDNARWSGTPFYIESGKSLAENLVEINVHFKEAIPCFCPLPHMGHKHQNMLSFRVKPKEGIVLRFWAKKPGLQNDIEPKNLTLEYGNRKIPESQAEAYEKVLFDCIAGEQMLFASTEEVVAAWRFVMPILTGWQRGAAPLKIYKKGKEL